MAAPLKGLKVLVVEDNYLIATLIEQILIAAGCIGLESIPRLAQATEAARRGAYDAALLDVNLSGERVYPVAEILSDRNIPYLFMTGYSPEHLPGEYIERPKLRKPFKPEQLLGALSNLVSVRRSDEVEVSVRHLRDLGFFDGEYYANALNREFMRACYPEVKTA
jgi:CheY-like chemotaxis protein